MQQRGRHVVIVRVIDGETDARRALRAEDAVEQVVGAERGVDVADQTLAAGCDRAGDGAALVDGHVDEEAALLIVVVDLLHQSDRSGHRRIGKVAGALHRLAPDRLEGMCVGCIEFDARLAGSAGDRHQRIRLRFQRQRRDDSDTKGNRRRAGAVRVEWPREPAALRLQAGKTGSCADAAILECYPGARGRLPETGQRHQQEQKRRQQCQAWGSQSGAIFPSETPQVKLGGRVRWLMRALATEPMIATRPRNILR